MKSRFQMLILALASAATLLSVGCERPKEEDCKKAVANIRKLYGTSGLNHGIPPQAAVRSCQGSATIQSVRCVMIANSITELEACSGSELLGAPAQPTQKGDQKGDQKDAPKENQRAQPGEGQKSDTGEDTEPAANAEPKAQ